MYYRRFWDLFEDTPFPAYLDQARITNREAASFAGVSVRTIERWCRGPAPCYARMLFALRAGYLGAIHPEFDGYRLTEGAIHTPSGHRFDVAKIEGMHWQYAIAREAKAENRKLRAKLAQSDSILEKCHVIELQRNE